MKKLLKQYGLSAISEYREMVINSLINGQRAQAKNQFLAMPKTDRKEFCKDVIFDTWHDEATDMQKNVGIFLFNLL